MIPFLVEISLFLISLIDMTIALPKIPLHFPSPNLESYQCLQVLHFILNQKI